MEAILWIVLGVVLAVAEIFTTTFFLIMLSVGAFAAAGAAALGAPAGLQVLVFALVSALAVDAVRRHLRPAAGRGETPFGVEALAGADALVLERVDAGGGMVRIDGEIWTARAYDATQVLAPGERVRVIEVRGATALVWRDDLSFGRSPHELPELNQ